jgi:hypothetical protein
MTTHNGLCPCGCNRPVPNNHYWATERCGKRANRKGRYMPHRYEHKNRLARLSGVTLK